MMRDSFVYSSEVPSQFRETLLATTGNRSLSRTVQPTNNERADLVVLAVSRDERIRSQERPQADGLQVEMERTWPSSQSSSANSYGAGDRFHAPGGIQNINQGGNQVTAGNFFAPVYFDSRSNDIDTAAQGTCNWLLRHERYTSWGACDQGLLWIKGKPGSGKSTLLRYVLNHAIAIPNTGKGALILSFFFHGRGSELQKTPTGLFRSLLHQLLRQAPKALTDLVATFQQHCETIGRPGDKWQWHPHELSRLFESSLPKVLGTRPVWLFVDALDECGQKNAVKLVRQFKSLLQGLPSTGLEFRICFTCRHYPILDQACQFEICLEDENGQDISTYVRAQLSASRMLAASTIPDLVTKRAQGVFIWAHLVVDRILDLDNKGAGLKKIEDEIYFIPPDLDDLYYDLIRNVDERPASIKLIQWICFAVRPLSLEELQWAMIVDPDCPHKSLQECKSTKDYISDSDRMKRRVQTLSCGLAEVTSDTNVVQFIHQSVKDFFVERGLSALDWPKWVIPSIYQSAKDILIEKGQPILGDSPRIYRSTALIGLATAFVYLHYFMRGPQSFLPGHALPLPIVLAVISGFWLHKGTSLVHVMSRYGVAGALWAILERADQVGINIDAKDSDGRTPLSWAAEGGHEAVVRLFLKRGAHSEAADKEGRTPLLWAAVRGYGAVMQLLLDRDAHIETADNGGRTPLLMAAKNGHEAVVRLLLEKGAEIDAKDKYGLTPLSYAAKSGHEAVVRLLFEKGAEIDAKDKDGLTPLSYAAKWGHEAVVKLLLDTSKVEIDSESNPGQTPLSYAA
ncbi:hypothetical protein DL771_003108 [Monosporascus sp. 5C6A]|nr:hypothetical protein DL771_003108 [Monosporascus sp. 5C6A]